MNKTLDALVSIYWNRLPLKRSLAMLLAGLCLIIGAGCGGGAMSQADMMRMSRKRVKKDKEEQPQQALHPTPQPTQQTAAIEPQPQKTPPASADKPPVKGKAPTEPLQQTLAAASSDTLQKPDTPLSAQERGQASAKNLDRIGQALEAYMQDNGKYPPKAIANSSKAPLLSWRVALLPYLGYQDLYEAFDLTKPWNSPANKPLLQKIPAIYQSLERYDTRTNYLFATGSGTLFPNLRTVNVRRVEDGIEHTVLVVEANEDLATPWTKPHEFAVDLAKPKQGLGQLRNGHAFVIWGGGISGAVPMSSPAGSFKAMFTIDGGESFSSYTTSIPLDEDFFAKQTQQPAPVAANTDSNNLLASPRSFSASSASPTIPASTLAGEFNAAAMASFAEDQPADALLWYYASNVLQSSNTGWASAYGWVPALKRPCATIHFCVGVQGKAYPGRGSHNGLKSEHRGTKRAAIVLRISGVGQQLLSIVERHAADLVPASLNTAEKPLATNVRLSARRMEKQQSTIPVTYLGLGTRNELIRQTTVSAGDVLVLFEAQPGPNGAAKWIKLELIDVARSRGILSISRIQTPITPDDLAALERDEVYRKKRWKLEDTLEDSLTLQNWPAGLNTKHVLERIQSIADQKFLNPLSALSEMSAYRSRGLIDTQQLLNGFCRLIGDQDGETLMLGSHKSRKRILRTWLPDMRTSSRP